jgi:hypothetical protein
MAHSPVKTTVLCHEWRVAQRLKPSDNDSICNPVTVRLCIDLVLSTSTRPSLLVPYSNLPIFKLSNFQTSYPSSIAYCIIISYITSIMFFISKSKTLKTQNLMIRRRAWREWREWRCFDRGGICPLFRKFINRICIMGIPWPVLNILNRQTDERRTAARQHRRTILSSSAVDSDNARWRKNACHIHVITVLEAIRVTQGDAKHFIATQKISSQAPINKSLEMHPVTQVTQVTQNSVRYERDLSRPCNQCTIVRIRAR